MLKMDIKAKSPIFLFVALLLLTFLIGVQQGDNVMNGKQNSTEVTTGVEKSDDGKNGVTFSASLLPSNDDSLRFEVRIDTHSGDLSGLVFQRDIVLEKDEKTYTSSQTDVEGAGHHLSTLMSFPKVSPPFTLVAKNIREIPRRELVF